LALPLPRDSERGSGRRSRSCLGRPATVVPARVVLPVSLAEQERVGWRSSCFGRPMKVKGLDANLGAWFGGGIGRGWVLEGRRSRRVVSVSAVSWSAGVISPLFGHATSIPAVAGVLA
jgi:hypothetical protein